MDGRRFDSLARRLAVSHSRRGFIRGLLAVGAGACLGTRATRTSETAAAQASTTSCRPEEAAFEHPRPVLRRPFRAVGTDEKPPCATMAVNPGLVPHVSTGYGGADTHVDEFFNDYFAVDLSTGASFPVLAAAAGTLRRHDEANGAGLFIRHNPDWQTKYLHLNTTCGLIVHPKTGNPVQANDPEFEVKEGTILGWTMDPGGGNHLHFALRGGSTSNFSSFESPRCCGNGLCNWSYPIPEIVPDLPLPQLPSSTPAGTCADQSTCRAHDGRSERARFCCPPAVVPGGVWSEVRIEGNRLIASARAYPTNEGDPAIDRVNFTLWWPDYGPRNAPWLIACTAYRPAGADRYACEIDLLAIGAPEGELTVSFDVYDDAGNHNLAPNGVKTVVWPDTPSDGCPEGQIRCNGTCVNPRKSWDHCGGCNHGCGIFQICCDGTCGCDGTSIIPFYCMGAEVICAP